LRLEPATAVPGQIVTAHLDGQHFGFYQANVYLEMSGQRSVNIDWASSDGYRSVATVSFLAPSVTGDWAARSCGYGEVAFCYDGHIGWTYGGACSPPFRLTIVSGAMVYLPSCVRWTAPANTAVPTLTPTATAMPTATRTPRPSSFGLDGYVWEGSASGPGVPDVAIAVRIHGSSAPPVTTDADGFYATPILASWVGAQWTVVPSKEGFTFEPPSVSGSDPGWPRHVQRVDFVAFRETPSPTPPTPATMRPHVVAQTGGSAVGRGAGHVRRGDGGGAGEGW